MPTAHHPASPTADHPASTFTEDVAMDASKYVRPQADRRNAAARDQLLRRIRAEFSEMPCLRLTRAQAQRLFGLRPDVCDRILATLVAERLIVRDNDHYRAYDDTPLMVPRLRDPE
jgi:hypothetical protein